jgi:camphor 5-monooxygenase
MAETREHLAPEHVPQDRIIEFDIYNPPNAQKDFHSSWKALQVDDIPELVWSAHNGGHWIATRNHVLNEILGDYQHFANTASILPKSAYGDLGLLPVTLDPPEHRPYRILLNSSLAPNTIKEAESGIRNIAVQLIESFRDDGHCDFITQFSTLFPVRVFLNMADLPLADAPLMKGWSDQMLRPEPNTDWGEDQSGWRRGIRLFREYLEPLVVDRMGSGRTDILTQIVSGEINGRPVNLEEALQLTVLVVLAGLDTVVNFLGFAMLHLARAPEQRRELVADPGLIPEAVEEFLRRFPIVTMAREVVDDYEYCGVLLKKGDMIATPTPLGGIDDQANACPMNVDFHRQSREHVSFGNGPHRCPGAFLARSEIRITLEEWLHRIPEFEIEPGHQVTFTAGGVAVVNALPLVWQN